MSAALLCGCVALLAWPSRVGGGRLRAAGQAWSWPAVRLSPLLAAGAASALAALVSTPLVSVLAGGCAWLAGRAWRVRRRAGAAEAELLALTEGLAVLAAELIAGRSPSAAARSAGTGCGDPEAARFLTAALADEPPPRRLSDGPAAVALTRIQAAARLSERTGCSLAAVATVLAQDLRARHRAALELRAATAGPRASAAVLAGLPVLGLAMGGGIGADPWRVLTTTAAGQALLAVGVGLEVLGIAWTSRLQRRALAGGGPPGGDRGS